MQAASCVGAMWCRPNSWKPGESISALARASSSQYQVVVVVVCLPELSACEISPVLGEKEQSEQFVDTLKQLYSADRNALFSTNFFGRTLRELMDEAMSRKLFALPLEAQDKVQQALTKMLNEGEGGMICILL